ncbi:protein Hook homolog 3 isoform X2 [Octopus sinensis]|uniref:Protein Hook homolog 3 isoform X2 n=1 Tax=Octopus sinensis TaxID=2607531 RepID=A0A6P7T075_9MOLL|nr:protein Hook homolog 3 isoform X2 [Octopus sinensis]
MDRTYSYSMLIKWLDTFNIEAPYHNTEELSTGIAMSQILNKIDPKFFHDQWLMSMYSDPGNNRKQRTANLQKILNRVQEFFSSLPNLRNRGFPLPDINAIAETSSMKELVSFLQLILVCAMYCEENTHIHQIMEMEESVQQVVMQLLKEVVNEDGTSSMNDSFSAISDNFDPEDNVDGSYQLGRADDQLRRTLDELRNVKEANEELTKRCHFLDEQMTSLQDEKITLSSEVDRLSERLNQAENLDDPGTPAGRRCQQLQRQTERLQEEVLKLESARDNCIARLDIMTEEFRDLQQKNIELNQQAEEARSLKDEVDELRYLASQQARNETLIQSYKRKFEEMGELRNKVNELHESNNKHIEEKIAMETELRKFTQQKSQLDLMVSQITKLENDLAYQTQRADKNEVDYRMAKNKLTNLQKEKEKLENERDAMKEVIEEDQERSCTLQTLTSLEHQEKFVGSLFTETEMLSIPLNIKEKLMRLAIENRDLKSSQSGDDEQSEMLRKMLDESNTKRNELEADLRLSRQKNLEQQALLEELQVSQTTADVTSTELTELKKVISEQKRHIQSVEAEVSEKKHQIEELDRQRSLDAEQIHRLQEQLNKKDDELKKMEEMYRRYLQKAKAVFKSLDIKQNPASGPEVQALRNQLDEKQKLIDHLEKDYEKSKVMREEEEKLIITAWYNLSRQLQRRAVDEKLSHNNSGQSFLTKQRQVHGRRI